MLPSLSFGRGGSPYVQSVSLKGLRRSIAVINSPSPRGFSLLVTLVCTIPRELPMLLAEAFKEGHVHHPRIPQCAPGQPTRTYRHVTNDNGVITRVVGLIEGEDGAWPVYHTEPCPPPAPRGYSAKALERAHWKGVCIGAACGIIGGCVGLLLFMVQHA
jgi:hypothetical protein